MEERQEKCRIAILDNCMIEVMISLQERGIPIKRQLQSYDRVLIPGWVWVEVCDSVYRKQFIHEIQQEGCMVEIVEEREYGKIVSQELLLLRIFKMSIRPYAQLKARFHKEVLEGKEETDIDYWYTEWIDRMYQLWPFKGKIITNSDGVERRQKKNAGEISIVFLTGLLTCQKKHNTEITIWSQDMDCKFGIDVMSEQMEKEMGHQVVASYKNLDVLLKEAYQQHMFDAEQIFNIIDEIRTERESSYLVKKGDSSIESHRENVDNLKYKEIVLDDDSMIIW